MPRGAFAMPASGSAEAKIRAVVKGLRAVSPLSVRL